MILVFIIFVIVGLLALYAIWFVPQDGRMLSQPEKIVATCFIIPFLGFGVWNIYANYLYAPSPISATEMAKNIIAWYDVDKDDKILIARESSVIHCESSTTCRTYSRKDLFEAVDTDKDAIVTAQELQTLLQTFDKDNSGKLDYAVEIQMFNKKYPQYSSNGFRKEGIKGKKEPLVE